MTQVDQFESVFRSAAGNPFLYERMTFNSILIVTDRDATQSEAYAETVKSFLSVLGTPSWRIVSGSEYSSASDLQALVETAAPDLVVTYRNLHSTAWQTPHSLGTHIDILVQQSPVPVMLTPHPDANYEDAHAMENTNSVTAVTDHLLNEHRLINTSARFTETQGTLHLMHIEDDATFQRYMTAISKIPSINTEEAEHVIARQLLREPARFIDEAARVLGEEGLTITLTSCVEFGHLLKTFNTHIENYKTDLLVMNTKDEDQLAMHGLAYPLAVELRNIAVLML